MLQASTGKASLDNELLHIWLSRYLPDLGLIPQAARCHFEERLAVVISRERRQRTYAKICTSLSTDCTMAAIQAQKLASESGHTLEGFGIKKA